MGEPVDFPEASARLLAPPGEEARVLPLPIARGNGELVSCWRLSREEIEEIARTGVVWLAVWGAVTQPPVFVTGRRLDVFADERETEAAAAKA